MTPSVFYANFSNFETKLFYFLKSGFCKKMFIEI
jgi:hypothetical protein